MGQINVRIDNELRQAVEKILRYWGLTHSDAIRIYYHQIINTKSIPLDLSMKEPSEATLEALKEVDTLRKKKKAKSKVKTYSCVKDLVSDLDV